jgi:molybdopterin-containing oxidoreductase family membrane subunit
LKPEDQESTSVATLDPGPDKVIGPGHDYGTVTDEIGGVVFRPFLKTPPQLFIGFACAFLLVNLLMIAVTWLFVRGVGVWGIDIPVAWGFAIVNFVWWIGIGHAGTLISAILFLLRQRWRTGVNRAAEAMTIFAVMCAGIYPAMHVGRVWYDWWLFPIPNSNSIWPQFRSPLMWDVFAVSTYFTVSVLFWYMGLIPDLAVMRDRAKTKLRQFLYGLGALGWTGSNRHWSNYEKAYLILAGLSTPLVLSVHSIVSLDFAVSQLPGWHTTIFPPYFVAGAVFSGFGMVLTLLVPLRTIFKLEDIITMRHIDVMCKVTLATGSIVGYAYAMEFFIAWYSGNPNESFHFMNRALGPYNWAWLLMVIPNVVVPQVFWFKKCRQTLWFVFIISIVVNVGMWFERFVIIVIGLHREFLPSNWAYYHPTWVDICTYIGTFGLFFTCFLLFIRFLPMIAISEVKGVTAQADPHHPAGGAKVEEKIPDEEAAV